MKLQKLSKLTTRKFIESYPGNGRKIRTPTGYVEVLECAHNHVVIDECGNEHYACNSGNAVLQTVYGNSSVKSVEDLNVEESMFDISIDSTEEVYYSNGVLSHNSGKTISTGIYLTHLYNFNKDINIGIVANKGPMAREFLANVKNMFSELPIWMQQGTTTWNKGSIESESMTRILTDVPTQDAFRGFTISCLSGNSEVNVYDKIDKKYKTITFAELYETCDKV